MSYRLTETTMGLIGAVIAISIFVGSQAYAFEATDDGSIDFPTIAYWKNKEVTGTGELNLPGTLNGKAPLVVLNHGTAGVGYREESWSDFLNEKGYATFVLDYFSPRGLNSRSRNLPRPGEDVWGALSILSTHPGLDMDKVAIMGFSNGGTVTLNSTAFDPEYKDTNGVFPKAFIMFYGGCHSAPSFNAKNYTPALLYVVGSEDKLVQASTCRERLYDEVTKDVEVMVIEGAYHMFDGNSNKTVNLRRWGEVTLRSDSGATKKARAKVLELLARVLE